VEELGLSLLVHGPDAASVLRPWLDRFGAEQRVHVEANVFEWEAAWPELVKASLYGHGHDVSEMGSTWVGSLIAMNALTPFSARELNTYGGASAFLPSVWQHEIEAGSGSNWALPWLAYTRLIYYLRDLLEKAGIDEYSAFQTHEQLEQTLRRLDESGVATLWCVPTRHSRDTLHNIASWKWNAGGEFASADGKHVLFNEPEARAGMRAYFDLHRYLALSARHRDESDGLFKRGQAAVVMSGPWLWPLDPHRPDVVPEVAANIGVALPLEAAYIGFSYLVVWKHSRKEYLAMKLVRALSGHDILSEYSSRTGPLSVRLDALDSSPLAGESNYQTMVRALKTGRTFPQISLWGLVEDKLAIALDKIWEEILAESQPDVDAIMSKHIDPLARRLELTLSQG
jgi:ABC-type glycerol-3-phosphate transport system substrate-binding protein